MGDRRKRKSSEIIQLESDQVNEPYSVLMWMRGCSPEVHGREFTSGWWMRLAMGSPSGWARG